MSQEKLFEKRFEVANPSNESRSDYVQVAVDHLEIPSRVLKSNDKASVANGDDLRPSLRLYRMSSNGDDEVCDVNYQIDHVFGDDLPNLAILTFKADEVPWCPNNEGYSNGSAKYRLCEGEFIKPSNQNDLYSACYYVEDDAGLGCDFDLGWDNNRDIRGLKIKNGNIEFFFSLKSKLPGVDDVDYSGSVTSLASTDHPFIDIIKPGDIQNTYDDRWARWGQVTDIVFFPAPWDLSWFQRKSIWSKDYTLVYKCSGPIRSVFTVKTGPFFVSYPDFPWYKSEERKTTQVECYLYRIIYAYPGKPWYGEQLVVLTPDGHSLSFRPYFLSAIFTHRQYMPDPYPSNLHRFEHIPDYFAVWKTNNLFNRHLEFGYGFASDSHIRGLELRGNDISWRLTSSHLKSCIHIFPSKDIDNNKLKAVANTAWYEQLYKPLRIIPLRTLFYVPQPDERYTEM